MSSSSRIHSWRFANAHRGVSASPPVSEFSSCAVAATEFWWCCCQPSCFFFPHAQCCAACCRRPSATGFSVWFTWHLRLQLRQIGATAHVSQVKKMPNALRVLDCEFSQTMLQVRVSMPSPGCRYEAIGPNGNFRHRSISPSTKVENASSESKGAPHSRKRTEWHKNTYGCERVPVHGAPQWRSGSQICSSMPRGDCQSPLSRAQMSLLNRSDTSCHTLHRPM